MKVFSYFYLQDEDFILLQAGTATSKRKQGVPNGNNVITLDNTLMTVLGQTYNANRFETTSEAKFIKQSTGLENV